MSYKPYLIRTPPFDPTSGGIRVMWGLFGWLLAKGQLAYVNTRMDVPTIGIYPEIYTGNEMDSQKVVRYILQKVGMMGTTDQYGSFTKGPTEFELSDEIIVFSKIYDTFGVDDDHLMFLPILNLNLFKDLKKKRTKTCYFVGKGTDTHKHPEDAILLNRKVASDQKALADLLNECQMLYGYEYLSAMYDIARLTGCPVTHLGGTKREELKGYEPGLEGIYFEGDDHKELDIPKFRYNYQELVKIFSDKLDIFIERTQSE